MLTLRNMADLLAANATAAAESPALGSLVRGQLAWLNWEQLNQRVDRQAQSLVAAGMASGDRVLVCGPNSVAWCVADLAIARAGGVSVPIHAATPADKRAELSRQVGAVLQVEEGEVSMAKAGDAGPRGPADLATIVFTSGTSGEPRGVMLTHANLISNATLLSEAVSTPSQSPRDEVRLCMLPLSHLYARTCDLYTWLVRQSKLVLAESRETILRDCAVVRPTAINSVPYFFQKLYAAAASNDPSVTAATLKQSLGGAILHCYSGGAPLAAEIETAFWAAGLPLMSGYGLTEASPVITASTISAHRVGAVGRPLCGVEVRLADDGEVLVAGPGLMAGYWRDAAATRESVIDGWLQTGDLGAWTDEGYLTITGRKKELIVLSTGKKASPAAIEARLAGSPWIEQVAVVGEGRPCLGAIIVPNPGRLGAEVRDRRLWVWSKRGALAHPHIRSIYAREIASRAADDNIGVFTLIDRGFSQELGEMTPKLSLRRNAIALNFTPEIATMYARRGAAINR